MDGRPQQILGGALLRAVDQHLRFEDRDQPGVEDLATDLELLVGDRVDARLVGHRDDRAHLRAEHALLNCPGEELVESRDRLHQLRAVRLVGEPLVDLEERDDLLLGPEVLRRPLAVDVPVHRALEQDGAEDPITAEARTRDHPRSHGVHDVEHLVVTGVLIGLDSIVGERLRSASPALVQGGEETPAIADLLVLLLVHRSLRAARRCCSSLTGR